MVKISTLRNLPEWPFAHIENPRVGGSIPPQATIQINGLHVFSHCKPFCFV
jgi:hypothetical protein